MRAPCKPENVNLYPMKKGGYMVSKVDKSSKKTKANDRPVAPVNKAREMTLFLRADQTKDSAIAEAALSPEMANASTTADYSKGIFPDIRLQDCIEVMQAEIKAVNGGNLDKLEGILTAQAEALNAVFNNLAKRSIHAKYMEHMDTYLRLALKAQSQCRTTVEAIAEIKYPKSATFIKQQNVANQQQVNNDSATSTPARVREKDITPTNELLTDTSNSALGTGQSLQRKSQGVRDGGNNPVKQRGNIVDHV